MPPIEGAIVLSPSGEPILTSQFSHHLDNYPLLHVDQLNARLARYEEGQERSSSLGRKLSRVATHKDWDFVQQSGDVLPIGLTEGLPIVEPDDGEDHEADGASTPLDRAEQRLTHSSAAVVHLEHNGLRFVAVVGERTNPLLPIAFLRALIAILERYFGAPLSEDAIRDNFDTVYQLLEEMLDESGQPLHTEYNTLRELVHEPSWVDDIVSRVSAVSGLTNAALGNAMSAPTLSAIPWRRSDTPAIKPRNEAYFDVIDTITGVFRAGSAQRSLGPLSIHSRIEGTCKLSATPDLLLKLSNAEKHIVDASLHPCVRLRAWKRERILTFVPPEGHFVLADFAMQSADSTSRHVPLSIQVSKREKRAGDDEDSTFSIRVSCTCAVEDVELLFGVGDKGSTIETTLSGGTRQGVASEDLNAVRGTFQYDARSGLARWSIARLSSDQRPLELSGTIKGDCATRLSTAVTCRFVISNLSLTGLKIESIALTNDVQYKPYKGARSIVQGDLDWRW